MGLFKNFDRNRWLYNGLIGTFILLYAATAFVSFYHAITFFNIANAVWLSVLLSFVAELGQASVLFGILLTENRKKYLPWVIMFILTSLQVIGNVVSSFDWIVAHNDAGLDGFKRSILFAVQTEDPEMFRIIVAWISGALLPIIALSMTALVAQNINLRAEEKKKSLEKSSEFSGTTTPQETIDAKDIISEVSRIRPTEEDLTKLESLLVTKKPILVVPKEEPDYLNKEVQEERLKNLVRDERNIPTEEDVARLQNLLDAREFRNKIPKEEEPIVEMGAPFDDPIYNPDMSQPYDPMDEYKKDLLSGMTSKKINESEPSIDLEPPETYMSTENVEEFDSNDFDIPDDDDDEFGPVDLTNEVPDVISRNNQLRDQILQGETEPLPEVVIKQNNGLIDIAPKEEKTIDETPPIIELEKKPDETPEIQKPVVPPPLPRSDHFTPEKLEKIRQIARDNLKKK